MGECSSIGPRPIEFEGVTFRHVMLRGKLNKKKIHPYIPRAWRWARLKYATSKTLVSVRRRRRVYLLPVHLYSSAGCSGHAVRRGNQKIDLSRWDNLKHLAITIAMVVAPTTLPFKLKSGESTVLYRPQRVLRQLGYYRGLRRSWGIVVVVWRWTRMHGL